MNVEEMKQNYIDGNISILKEGLKDNPLKSEFLCGMVDYYSTEDSEFSYEYIKNLIKRFVE